MRWIAVAGPVVLVAACAGGGGRAQAGPVPARPLAVLTSVTTMHGGMGSSSERVQIGAAGEVRVERLREKLRCGVLDSAGLQALRAAIRAAIAAGLRERYTTSSRPGPDANYSRMITLELDLDGEHRVVQIEGWADYPAELRDVLGRVSAAMAGCSS